MTRVLCAPRPWRQGLLVLACVAVACQGTSERPDAVPQTLERWLSGVISPREAVLGRSAHRSNVLLLTGNHRVVSLDLSQRRLSSLPIDGLTADDHPRGFGVLADGSMWTLAGYNMLLGIGPDGSVAGRHQLPGRQAGLHSGFAELLFQPLTFTAGVSALTVAPSGDGPPRPIGRLRVAGGAGNGAVRFAQSLVACGLRVQGRIPCWLANAATVDLLQEGRQSRLVEVAAAADWIERDPGAFADRPRRVFRDVYADRDSGLWVLIRPEAKDAPDSRGEVGLWRIDGIGRVTARYRLPVRARLILDVVPGWVVLLDSDGDVVAVPV